ncbi:hypothetical protein CAPTEDRAFT_228216 [Capitella teleta]|uniref:ABC transmembrane type-1 domain-containing protein n=1 Tax=Capitella teleta TaxID=283909 RepID=R7U5N6_CAPTE|nr:hypothetical protein CAPTEDRAFT_228216 [Capitella teleta]|eukprot:ELU01685.1 hypothetical protein CAPTEDRAFT_228216 [Capitella teleta]
MPRLSTNERRRAVGMLEAGSTQVRVARAFDVARSQISRLWSRYRETGSVKDRPRSGRPRMTTRLLHPESASPKQIPTSNRHCNNYRGLAWPSHQRTHCPKTLRSCRDECPTASTSHHPVEQEQGEPGDLGTEKTEEYNRWGGPSVMVWAGITMEHRTVLVIVHGNITARRYIDEILTPHVLPFKEAHPDIRFFPTRQRSATCSSCDPRWVKDILQKGYKKELDLGDLYEATHLDKSGTVYGKLERAWAEELAGRQKGKEPSLTRAFYRSFKGYLLVMAVLFVIQETLYVTPPILLGFLLRYFQNDSDVTTQEAYLYAMGIGLCSFFVTFIHHPLCFVGTRLGMWLRISAGTLMYRKLTQFIHVIWLAPLEMLIVMGILWSKLGPSSLAGLALLLLLIPLQGVLAKLFSVLRRKTAKHSDARVSIMSEILTGVRIIKMYCWEKPFGKLVADVRQRESKRVYGANYCRAISTAPAFSAAKLVAFFTFLSTDALIQETIRKKFRLCTVLTVAHRLHTIVDSDRVMVLDSGEILEFDAPATLLSDTTSNFYQMAAETGPDELSRLIQTAEVAHTKNSEEGAAVENGLK